MNNNILIGIFLVILSQTIIWFQVNAQFLWEFCKERPFLLSLLGIPISYLVIQGTKYFVNGFNGLIWPGRLIGFAIGIIIFGILTHILMKETLNIKTILSIILSMCIVMIQLFMKN